MDFLAGLNPQQIEAVRHADGPLLILAGAGSGKTRVITHRIAYMICERDVAPWSILAVTFTNKAAGEMRSRVESLLEGRIPAGTGPTVSTFHSFCVKLLRRNGASLAEVRPGFTRNFNIYDDDDQVSLLKSIYRELAMDQKALAPRSALSMISKAKGDKISPDEMREQARDPVSKQVAELYARYEAGLRTSNALDFDDLLLESVRLLQHDPAVRLAWNQRIHYLMIDEYQDTNRSQYELMRLLAGDRRNVCVVGDEDQSIYSWRGADIKNILDFERDFPRATVIRLEQNYRSTKAILEASGAVVANNMARKGKKLWTAGAPGESITLYEAYDGENEALYIAETIEKVFHRDTATRVAVLYRTNFQSRPIEEALRRYRRKYVVVGGLSFYQRAEIKDLLAYLRLQISPTDNVALYRIINTPARGIGKSSIDAIEAYSALHKLSAWDSIEALLRSNELSARAVSALTAFRDLMIGLRNLAGKPVNEILDEVIEQTGYQRMWEQAKHEDGETRVANIQELLNAAVDANNRGEDIAAFLDHAALVSDADQVDEKAQVSLLTIHNAKGLEFPVVFIAGLEEGLFPHVRSLNSEAMLEEERRLCYVGMTRAEKLLYLSWARQRRKFGGAPPEPSIQSRFIREVPPPLIKKAGGVAAREELDLFSEQYEARHSVRKNLYTGKTYNSVENVAQFFQQRGTGLNRPTIPQNTPLPGPKPAASPAAAKPVAARSKSAPGASIQHPKYGRGIIVRKEGEGPDAKITVSFPGHGLKKLIARYAGIEE
ncbi:MAG: UvrD-helicase domain-containing protein [Candidatus Solibacter usitatus]|nr:UvrD-helicase domain-containing protein [Candidatus Solibacter usitatus]